MVRAADDPTPETAAERLVGSFPTVYVGDSEATRTNEGTFTGVVVADERMVREGDRLSTFCRFGHTQRE